MGKILKKARSGIRDFFDQSKRMVQKPKELPPLNLTPAPRPATPPTPPPQNQLLLKTEIPKLERHLPLPTLELPKIIDTIQPPPRKQTHDDDLKSFEDAIRNMRLDTDQSAHEPEQTHADEIYKPQELGEGYFSEIEHYLKHKDVKEIIDDIMHKDFLTGMKDYHDSKAQGKPFYLHDKDLTRKLEDKMSELRKQEERWHTLKRALEQKEHEKKEIEHEIDKEGQDLKELFRLIKINQILEKEAPKGQEFKLRSGQQLRNLNDLRKALSYMQDAEFKHHTQESNDFSNWTRHALENPVLADKIRQTTNKDELQHLLSNPI